MFEGGERQSNGELLRSLRLAKRPGHRSPKMFLVMLWLLRAEGPAVLTSHPLRGTQPPARSWPRTLAIGVFPMLPPQDTLLL